MKSSLDREVSAWFCWVTLGALFSLGVFHIYRAVAIPDPDLRHQALVEALLLHLPVIGAGMVLLAFWPRLVEVPLRTRWIVALPFLAVPLVMEAAARRLLEWYEGLQSLSTLLAVAGIYLGVWALARLLGWFRGTLRSRRTA